MIQLIKDERFKRVLSFLIVYRFVMQLFVTPFLLYLGKLLLNYHSVQFMTPDKMIFLLSKPSVWLYLILSLGTIMFLLLLELASTIVLSQYTDVENYLLPFSLGKLKWALKPRNLVFLPILMTVLLGFHFGMTSIITDSLFIPEFILDTIVKTPSYMFLYTAISILAFVIAFHLLFLFHNLFIAQSNFKEAITLSISMVRGNRVNFLLSAMKIGFQTTLFAAVVYLITLSVAAFIIYVVPPFLSFNAVSISILFVINKILVFLAISSIAAVNVMFITRKYQEYGGKLPQQAEVSASRKSAVPKYILVSLMFVTLIFQGYGAYQTTMSFDRPEYLKHTVYITSHRGNSSVAPENTIAAIRAAKEEHSDVAEIDVQLTSDGHVVVIHDFTLSRLANDSRRVINLTLEELKELEVGSWFAEEFKGEKIPTLEEVIEEAGMSIKLNIELKPTKDEAQLAKAVIDILEEQNYEERVIISSLNKQALKEVKKMKPTLDAGYIVPVALGSFEFEETFDFYSIEMFFLTKSLVEQIKNQGKEVHAWTVNSEEDMKRMQQLQVNNIITDDPILAQKVLATNLFEKGILEILSLLEL